MWSSFSRSEWLCCSLVAPNAHSWPENLLTLHLIYQERRRQKMYYRVAIQVDAAPPWKWQSTALSSLGSLLQWLQVYRAFPHERLRIFSSSSREALNEQLEQENQGLASTSVTAVRFLRERRLCPPAGSGVPRSIVGNSLDQEEGTER